MPFDLSSAKPVGEGDAGGFDIGSAKPVAQKPVEIKGTTPSEIYYNFVISGVPAERAKAALTAKGMEFNPRLYREALASAVASPQGQDVLAEATAKTYESALRGGVGAGASMLEGVAGVVPGETATDVEKFFREQEQKQRQAAPYQDVYGGAKAVTQALPYAFVGSKVAGARALATPLRQLLAQPLTQAATAYALTPRGGPLSVSDLVGEQKPPEGGVFGLLPTTGSRKADEAITAGVLTGAFELPFTALSAAPVVREVVRRARGKPMPPAPAEKAAYDILQRREAELAGGPEAQSLDEQLATARAQEEERRRAVAELQQKQAAEAAERQRVAAEAEAQRTAQQQALIEQRRQAEAADAEARRQAQARIDAAEAERQRLKEEAADKGEQLKAEAAEPDKAFPDEAELLRQEKINDARAAAESDLEGSAAQLEERAAKRESQASVIPEASEIKKYDLGERIRQIFLDTRDKLLGARKAGIRGVGAEGAEVTEGTGALPHERAVADRAKSEPLSSTPEFQDFATDIKAKAEDPDLTPPLKRVYQYIKDVIDTKEGERAISWQLVRNLRREVADKISPTPETSFKALPDRQYKDLSKQLDDLLDAYVGGTKEAPGPYKSFMEAYKEGSRPLDIFKFGPGKTATEMAEWGRGLEYDREDVIKAAMHPTRSNAEQIVELSGNRVGETADVIRDFLLKEAAGDPKKLADVLDKYNEFLDVPAFSGVRDQLENLARTNKVNSGIAARLRERAETIRATAESVKNLPEQIRKVLNVRDFSSDNALAQVSAFVSANPSARGKVGEALTSLVDGMPDEQTIAALSNPNKRAALIRAGLPEEAADSLLSKANAAIADRAAKIQEAAAIKREAQKAGRAAVKEARAPVTAERQKVREAGAEIGRLSAERRAAAATERATAAQERAALAEARGQAKEARGLRVTLEERRRALTDINQRPELASEIIDAASEIPINTMPGLVNATTMATVFGTAANFLAGSPILTMIASAIGATRAISSRAAKLAMEGTEREAIRNRIKEELQKMLTSPLKREETRQVIENYNDVMEAQRQANQVLRTLGVIPPAEAITARAIYQGYGEPAKQEEQAPAEEQKSEAPKEDIEAAITSQKANALRPIIDAIYAQESSSGKNPEAQKENYAGAKGGMQVTPVAFKEVQDKGYIPKDYDIENPQHRMEAGVAYIKYLAEKYNYDPEKIAAAYYSGPDAISASGQVVRNRRDPKNPKAPNVGQYVDTVLSRIIPTAEASERPMQKGGLVEPGNIDTSKLPVLRNPDGTISTVSTIGIGTEDGLEVVIPTIINGRRVSEEEARKHYEDTHQHFGIFNSVEAANAFAQKLHEQEAQRTMKKSRGGPAYSPEEQRLLMRYASR